MLSVYAQQTMLDTLPVAACIFTGREHELSAANDQMLAVWGVSGDVAGNTPDELFGPEGRSFMQILDKVYQTGQTQRHADQPRGNDWYDHFFKALLDQQGHIYGVVHTAVEVTGKIRALRELEGSVQELAGTNLELNALNEEYLSLNEEMEATNEELRASNEELLATREQLQHSLAELGRAEEHARLAAEAVELGTYDVDLRTGEVYSSGKLAGIFGFDAPATWPEYLAAIHPEDRPLREQAHQQAIAGGRLFYEVRLRRPDNELRWIRAKGKVSYDESGEPKTADGYLAGYHRAETG